MLQRSPERLRRSRIFYSILFLFFGSLTVFLLIALQSLLLPVVIGALAAYISSPLLKIFIRKGIPKGVGILLLFSGLVLLIFVVGRQIVSMLPDEREQLELRVSIQYKLNDVYLSVMGKEKFDDEGNFLFRLVGDELYPIMQGFNTIVAFNPVQDSLFQAYLNPADSSETTVSEKVQRYYRRIQELPKSYYQMPEEMISADAESEEGTSFRPNIKIKPADSKIAAFFGAVSIWIILPFVFIFLLLDDGDIEHFVLSLVPNRYFEMSLTTLDNVDKAIGLYLRGTLIQCSLVFLSFIPGLVLIGLDVKASVFIGLVAGIANAIPFLGPVIGLVIGIGYSLIAQVDPILPFLTEDHVVIGVVVTVVIVQLLDNAIFAPMVLGKAVNLHPLVVIIGITGGSVIFGFIGMLFAIPTIVVFNVLISTVYRQLKDYYIIY